MALKIVSIPIGNPQDISLRALDALKNCEQLVVEEPKAARAFLKHFDLHRKPMLRLSEHSDEATVRELVELCQKQDVCLISDCGTPVFCDPGARLIAACRKNAILSTSLPGASSLMCLLSQSSQALDNFQFYGFIPQKNQERQNFWQQAQKNPQAFIVMDTPYRLQKSLQELQKYLPTRKILLSINATYDTEKYIECYAKEISRQKLPDKAEFIILIYPA